MLIVAYLTPFLIISKIGCPFPLSLRRTKASLAVDRLQQGEPSLFKRLLPNVNVVPSRFWFPLGLPCLQVDPMEKEKKTILSYALVISFLPRHANTHRVPK